LSVNTIFTGTPAAVLGLGSSNTTGATGVAVGSHTARVYVAPAPSGITSVPVHANPLGH
jgi:hypothetical protein